MISLPYMINRIGFNNVNPRNTLVIISQRVNNHAWPRANYRRIQTFTAAAERLALHPSRQSIPFIFARTLSLNVIN